MSDSLKIHRSLMSKRFDNLTGFTLALSFLFVAFLKVLFYPLKELVLYVFSFKVFSLIIILTSTFPPFSSINYISARILFYVFYVLLFVFV